MGRPLGLPFFAWNSAWVNKDLVASNRNDGSLNLTVK
jgi:hypothetical protein